MAAADEAALIAAVVAAPDDDAPRWAYAEWLTARGDPRGEFTARQLREPGDGSEWANRKAADTLRETYGADWAPPVKGLHVSAWRRGFPDAVFITGEDFLAGAEALFAAAPVREVALYKCGATLEAIARRPELARLRRLGLGDEATPQGMAAVAASPWVANLTALEMIGSPIGDAGAAALADSAVLRRLENLTLVGAGIGPEGAARLAASKVLAHVTQLNLNGNPLAGGMIALAASPHLGRLEWLWANDCAVDDAGAAALAASSGLPNLQRLQLKQNRIHDAGGAAFATAPGLGRLLALDLSENSVGDGAAAALATSTALAALRELDLSSNVLGELGAEALRDANGLPALMTLCLSYNPIYVPGATEDWRDWDGGIVGSGPVKMDTRELQTRYGRRFTIK